MEEINAIPEIQKFGGFFEVYHKNSYLCYRRTKKETVQKVIVEILDRGLNVKPDLRYFCEAKSEDGKKVSGNPASSIDSALARVHWEKLD